MGEEHCSKILVLNHVVLVGLCQGTVTFTGIFLLTHLSSTLVIEEVLSGLEWKKCFFPRCNKVVVNSFPLQF